MGARPHLYENQLVLIKAAVNALIHGHTMQMKTQITSLNGGINLSNFIIVIYMG